MVKWFFFTNSDHGTIRFYSRTQLHSLRFFHCWLHSLWFACFSTSYCQKKINFLLRFEFFSGYSACLLCADSASASAQPDPSHDYTCISAIYSFRDRKKKTAERWLFLWFFRQTCHLLQKLSPNSIGAMHWSSSRFVRSFIDFPIWSSLRKFLLSELFRIIRINKMLFPASHIAQCMEHDATQSCGAATINWQEEIQL